MSYCFSYIAQDHYEKFHLKFIKWALSVHSKASNIGCWGETGRHPLFYEASKLALDYFERIENSENEVLLAAFHEQVTLGPPWYTNISKLLTKHYSTNSHALPSKCKLSTQIAHNMRKGIRRNVEESQGLIS